MTRNGALGQGQHGVDQRGHIRRLANFPQAVAPGVAAGTGATADGAGPGAGAGALAHAVRQSSDRQAKRSRLMAPPERAPRGGSSGSAVARRGASPNEAASDGEAESGVRDHPDSRLVGPVEPRRVDDSAMDRHPIQHVVLCRHSGRDYRDR
jgi:hypothetical protein